MKKQLLTLALVAMTSVAAYSQGTIAFGNSALTRVAFIGLDGVSRNAKAADGLTIAVFFGPANTTDASALHAVLQPDPQATIGATEGVMVNAPSVFALTGTNPGDVVSLQIRAWDKATTGQVLFGQTDIRQVTLAPTAGPGAVIWQTATGTNPNRFTPLQVHVVVPEPSTIALGVLGLGSLLLFRRRK